MRKLIVFWKYSIINFEKTYKIENPYIAITLKIFLSMIIINCGAEYSFSKLKSIANDLKNTVL